VVYSISGCGSDSYSNIDDPFEIYVRKCFDWKTTATVEIVIEDSQPQLIINLTSDFENNSVDFVLTANNEYVTSFVFQPTTIISVGDYFTYKDELGLFEVRFELLEMCNMNLRTIKNITFTPDLRVCEDVRDVFVSTFRASFNYYPPVTLNNSVDLFGFYGPPFNQVGRIWRLCNNEEYDFILSESRNDRVVVRTHDKILFDSYDDDESKKPSRDDLQSDDRVRRIKIEEPALGACLLSEMFDFTASMNVESNYDHPVASISVNWNPDYTYGAVVDVFDNGVLVAQSIDTRSEEYKFGVSFNVFALSSEKGDDGILKGRQHSIVVREHCAMPVYDSTHNVQYVTVKLPCSVSCLVSLYEDCDFSAGYVTVSSKRNSDVVYFAGSPSFDSFEPFPSLYTFPICSGDMEVKLVLPKGYDVNPDDTITFVQNSSGDIIPGPEGEWIINEDAILVNSSFTSVDEVKEFVHICDSCYPPTVEKYELVVNGDGKEVLVLSGVSSYFDTLWVFLDRLPGVMFNLTNETDVIEMIVEDPEETHCVQADTCNFTDDSRWICIKSPICAEPNVTIETEYEIEESLTINFTAEYCDVVVHPDSVRLTADDGNKWIDLKVSDFHPGNVSYVVTDLDYFLGKNVCVVYSFIGCDNVNYSNAENPTCLVLEKKSWTLVIVLCSVAGALIIALLVGLLLWLKFRPRGESKEAFIEMEFPEDNFNDQQIGSASGGNDESMSESAPSKSASGSEKSKDSADTKSASSGNKSTKSESSAKSKDSSKSAKSSEPSSKESSNGDDSKDGDDDSVSVSSASDSDN